MKFIVLFAFFSAGAFAQGKNKEENFEERVQKEVLARLEKLGKKNITLVASELMERSERLDRREEEIKNAGEELKKARADFERQVVGLRVEQEKFISCLDQSEEKKKERLDRLVEIISNMQAQKASDLLSVQDPEITVELMGRLPPEKVSKIFNLMDKEVSARLQKRYVSMKK